MGPSRRGQVPPFEVMSIVDRVARLRTEGADVVSLCVGEPIQGAPHAVRQAMAAAMDGRPLGYSSPSGLAELRSALAGLHRTRYGIDVDPRNIVVTTGSSGAFILAFLSAFDAGQAVAVPRPGYPAYANILRSLNLDVVEIPAAADEGYRLHIEDLAAAHARTPLSGVVVASPNNPTGTMMTAEALGELAAWCSANGVRLVSDEIYHGITADGSIGACAWACGPQDSLVVSSFSKYWGMTGWRLGWMLVPEDLIEAVDALSGNLALCAPVPAQVAALAAFGEQAEAEARRAIDSYAEGRALVSAASSRLGWREAPAEGAFYVYADISSSLREGEDSRVWCTALLDEAGVAITPGWDFDRVNGGHTVRLSLAVGPQQVAEALARIEAWLVQR